ncbi:MAG: hypothetical protein Q7T55_04465, partial [Solirubrobacteraceae bacterium]|nr:hypothetical protein [Solirubrobacteraceae bacterium]
MKPSELLRIFAEVAAEHETTLASNAPPRVIPIVTDDLGFRPALLSELSLALGGTVLDVTGGDFAGPVAGRDQPTLRGELPALKFTDARGTTYGVSLEFSNGEVDAKLLVDGSVGAPGSTGQQQLLGLSRALFSSTLDDAELAVVRYSETVLDPEAVRAAWSLLLGFAARNRLRFGGVRTLVLLVQVRDFSVANHVGPHGGARFVQTAETVGKRKPQGFTRKIAQRLAVHRQPPLVMFLGAGFSVSSSLPTGNALRDSAIRRLLKLDDVDDGRSPLDLATEFVAWAQDLPKDIGRLSRPGAEPSQADLSANLTLEQVSFIDAQYSGQNIAPAVAEFRELHNRRLESHEALGSAVLRMRELVRRHPRLVLVTDKFDELVEIEEPDLFERAVTDEEFGDIAPRLAAMVAGEEHPDGKVPLLKLHGTISDEASCVADELTVREGISQQKRDALFSLMPSVGRGREEVEEGQRTRWVYVGASMRDAD